MRAANALHHCIRLLAECTNDREIRGILAQSLADSEASGKRICFKAEGEFRSPHTLLENGERVAENVGSALQKREMATKNVGQPSKAVSFRRGEQRRAVLDAQLE